MANNTLFGTDGVRGTAGRYPLDPPTVRRLGAALVRALRVARPKFLVGRDGDRCHERHSEMHLRDPIEREPLLQAGAG